MGRVFWIYTLNICTHTYYILYIESNVCDFHSNRPLEFKNDSKIFHSIRQFEFVGLWVGIESFLCRSGLVVEIVLPHEWKPTPYGMRQCRLYIILYECNTCSLINNIWMSEILCSVHSRRAWKFYLNLLILLIYRKKIQYFFWLWRTTELNCFETFLLNFQHQTNFLQWLTSSLNIEI